MPDLKTEAEKAVLAVLASAKPFHAVSDEVRQALLQSANQVTLKGGKLLFQQGQAGDSMFVVISGLIEVSISTADGRKVLLNRLGPGQCFGEISMIDGLARTAETVALTETRLMSISRAVFLEVAKRYPELSLAMIDLLCERVRWLSDSVEDYAVLPLERRLARRLQILFDRFGGAELSIEIAQSDLADFVGASRESVNKILMAWRKDGLISMGRKTVQLLSKDGLAQIANQSEN